MEQHKQLYPEIERARKAKVHLVVSLVKSVFRLVGYVALAMAGLPMNGHDFHPRHLIWAAVMLFLAEVLGVAEEIWGA